jgi:hypothetical protein
MITETAVQAKKMRGRSQSVHSQGRRKIIRVVVPIIDTKYVLLLLIHFHLYDHLLPSANHLLRTIALAFAANSLILGNHGVPKPITASHPFFAGKPCVPQPTALP